MKPYKRNKKKNNNGFARRAGFTNRHHNLSQSRGGETSPENIINLDERRHAAFHLLFKEMTFGEAARLLWRVERMMKRRKRETTH